MEKYSDILSYYRLFRKKDRIKKNKEINDIIYHGKKVICCDFDYFYKKTGKNRFEVIVRKNIGNSVKRNKIKRRIKEIYRKSRREKKNESVIKVKNTILKKKFKEIEKDIKSLLKK